MGKYPSIPRADRQLVSVCDASPVSVLACVLILKRSLGIKSLGVTLVSCRARPGIVRRIKALLERRNIDVALYKNETGNTGFEEPWFADILDHAMSADGIQQPILDLSGADSGLAVRAYRLASDGFDGHVAVMSYEHEADRILVLEPRGPGQKPNELNGDMGDPDCGGVGPAEFLELFGLRVKDVDPYSAAIARQVPRGKMVEAAKAILNSFRDDNGGYGNLRRNMGRTLANGVDEDEQTLDVEVSGRFLGFLRPLEEVGLLTVDSGGGKTVLHLPDRDQGAVFFLRGGWLEVLVHEALRLAMPDRSVVCNLRSTWGPGNPWVVTSAESDVVFLRHNRLHVVSCKNDLNKQNLLHELGRFRALTAEFGESWVRPILLSTEKLGRRLQDRCGAYEIGAIWGERLLDILREDLVHGRTGALLDAIESVEPGTPVPGIRLDQRSTRGGRPSKRTGVKRL